MNHKPFDPLPPYFRPYKVKLVFALPTVHKDTVAEFRESVDAEKEIKARRAAFPLNKYELEYEITAKDIDEN